MKNVKIMLVIMFVLLNIIPIKAQGNESIVSDSVIVAKVGMKEYNFSLDSLIYCLEVIIGKPITNVFPEELKFSEDVLSKKFITSHTFRRMKSYVSGYRLLMSYDGIKVTVKVLEFGGVCNWWFVLLAAIMFVAVILFLANMEKFSDLLYPLCGLIMACGILFKSGLLQCGIL